MLNGSGEDTTWGLESIRTAPVRTHATPRWRSSEGGDGAPDRPIVILFLAATPEDQIRLRLLTEMREIQARLRELEAGHRLVLKQEWAVRPSDLQGHLLRHQPDIVHFSGHGSADGELLFQGEPRDAKPVTSDALARLFEILSGRVTAVVLNACHSERLADTLRSRVDCVIGMNGKIADTAAIAFSSALYRALGSGQSMRDAYALGCNQIEIEGHRGADIPVLLCRDGVDPTKVVFRVFPRGAPADPERSESGATQVVLFLAANPRGTDSPALDREARAIQREFDAARPGARLRLETRWATEPLDLLSALGQIRPSVVHFSAHGRREVAAHAPHAVRRRDVAASDDEAPADTGGLRFIAPDSTATVVSPDAVARAFAAAGGAVRVVVLNACYTDTLASALLAHVDCVIGMHGAVGDAAALSFAIGFYGALAGHASIRAAFDRGCTATGLQCLPDAERPQLRVRPGIEPLRLVLSVATPRAGVRAPRVIGIAAAALVATTAVLGARHAPEPRPAARPAPAMVELGAAAFVLGSTPAEIERAKAACDRERPAEAAGGRCASAPFEREGPVRLVALSAFAIDRTEVTNEAFAAWLSSLATATVEHNLNGSYVVMNNAALIDLGVSEVEALAQPRGARFVAAAGAARHPVVGTSGIGADAYCRAHGLRLPTEAEWEYAARGVTRRQFPWGDVPDPAALGCALRVGHVRGDGCHDPRPVVDVGATPVDVTPEGVRDLAGNAEEWVADVYVAPCDERDATARPRDRGAGCTYQVIRGGSHVRRASSARGAARSHALYDVPAAQAGFRCAVSR